MDIEIEKFSLKELVELHDKIARQIWKLQRTKLSEKVGEFQIGDKISFQNEGKTITGIVIRVNRKSFSVRTQENCWYINPWGVTKLS